MLSSELAKQLKDAGFPQKTRTQLNSEDGRFFCFGTDKECYRSTLDELIMACVASKGAYCFELIGPNVESIEWLARINPQDSNGGRGKTAIEAVANLYLALKTK